MGDARDTVRVYYSCACGLSDRRVLVPRRGRSVDLFLWMDMLGRGVAEDHAAASPSCASLSMSSIKIPSEPHAGIGEVDWPETPPWDEDPDDEKVN
jgi:hypothetical protein